MREGGGRGERGIEGSPCLKSIKPEFVKILTYIHNKNKNKDNKTVIKTKNITNINYNKSNNNNNNNYNNKNNNNNTIHTFLQYSSCFVYCVKHFIELVHVPILEKHFSLSHLEIGDLSSLQDLTAA